MISGPHHFRLAPEVLGRTGAVAIAALFLLPLTALAIRRRWAQYVLGGSLLILLLMEVPWLFVHLSDAASLSQARRAAGFAPLPFAFAGAFALAARRFIALPAALAAGIVLQLVWPGDFGVGLRHGGPALATWVALIGGLVALAAVLVLRPRPRARASPARRCRRRALRAAGRRPRLLALGARRTRAIPTRSRRALIHNLRTKVPKGAIVIAPVRTSYEIAAVAPVYVVAAPVTHVANTDANDPYRRVNDVHRWIQSNDPAIARRYGATWAIRAGRLYRLPR